MKKPVKIEWTPVTRLDDAVNLYWEQRTEVLRKRGWLGNVK